MNLSLARVAAKIKKYMVILYQQVATSDNPGLLTVIIVVISSLLFGCIIYVMFCRAHVSQACLHTEDTLMTLMSDFLQWLDCNLGHDKIFKHSHVFNHQSNSSGGQQLTIAVLTFIVAYTPSNILGKVFVVRVIASHNK